MLLFDMCVIFSCVVKLIVNGVMSLISESVLLINNNTSQLVFLSLDINNVVMHRFMN
jgi:hypothetical protein